MALGDERAHAELVGERHGRAIATFCRSSVEGIGARSDVGEEAECPGLVATFGAFAGCGMAPGGRRLSLASYVTVTGPPGRGDRRRSALKLPCMKPAGRVKSALDSSRLGPIPSSISWKKRNKRMVLLPPPATSISPPPAVTSETVSRWRAEAGDGLTAERRGPRRHALEDEELRRLGRPDPSMVPFRYTPLVLAMLPEPPPKPARSTARCTNPEFFRLFDEVADIAPLGAS